MPHSFEDQVAVVTGATGGIGRATAIMLASRGARLVITDLHGTKLDEVAQSIGDGTLAMEANLANPSECQKLVAKSLDHFGRFDVLANVAGDYTAAPIEDMSEEAWQAMFDANLRSTFNMMVAAVPIMRDQGSGRIVNISSVDALVPKPKMVHYAAAKAGVDSLTKSFAAAYGADGIAVNGVAPGPVATERAKSEGWLAGSIEQTVLGRAAEPEDIAEVVAFLASEASRCITGETIIASCGHTMR
jgi:3-oxoacyl-[acyl-carrier protein] reductase